MEIFSRIMGEYTGSDSGFKFHPKCSTLQLTHLCFADDMLLFYEASVSSIKVVKAALLEFEQLSGLRAIPSKSYCFCAGLSSRMKAILMAELQLEEGQFPIRYLGVPLISFKLFAANCRMLIEKITSRIGSWTSKQLSFTGRLQLITFVLYGLQVYWTSIFIMPKSILKDIFQKFNRFLWNGKDGESAKANVGWSDICFPKFEGGLGLKCLETWNIS
jgi:hypothetical protein